MYLSFLIDRPIMLLLKRLIRNKQNTVMTNSQIIEILKLEFDIEISNCQELEVDIYIKIIKKYLKDWPQWEELERISSKLSNVKDFDAVAKVLNHKYKNLKEYLGVMLEASKPLAKKAVAEITVDSKKEENVDSSEVVMEVYCTREQLNQLFFRKPRTDLNNAIFNIDKIEPTKISLNTLTFESILNFWWTKIYIQLPNFTFYRELSYKYKHMLVNKVRDEKLPTEILDTQVYNKAKKVRNHFKTAVNEYLDKILQLCTDEHILQLLQVIFHVLNTDLLDLPDMVNIPSNYRKNLNQFNYVRYLYVENEESNNTKYDLQLEEVLTPSCEIFFGRLGKFPDHLPPVQEWLKIECMMCKVKFMGSTELMSLLQAHFNDCHQYEPDWQCPHCKRLFSMDFLSKSRWCHEC